VNIIVRSRDEKKAYLFAREIRDALRKELVAPVVVGSILQSPVFSLEIIGPAPLPFYKLRGHFRWHVMLKVPNDIPISPKVYELLTSLKKSSAVAFQLDVDPLNIL
jgi:primosomal protein N' (replication factor Y)